ncbi:TPA: hypothetical protein ACH5I5_000890, partial [Klebsiella variicola]
KIRLFLLKNRKLTLRRGSIAAQFGCQDNDRKSKENRWNDVETTLSGNISLSGTILAHGICRGG